MSRGRLATWLAVAAACVAGVAVVVTVAVAGSSPQSLAARTTAIAQDLRCPTCDALSVAQSDSPMAMSMRAEIRQQLRRGDSADEIRSWFADRYGQQVLMTPSAKGVGLLLWTVPVAALVGGLVAVVTVWRRRRGVEARSAPPRGQPVPITLHRLGVVAVAIVAVAVTVTAVSWRGGQQAETPTAAADSTQTLTAADWVAVGQSLEKQQSYDAAADAYRAALHEQPQDRAVRTRLAFVLVRAGKPESAATLVGPMTHQGTAPQRAEALLVLGLAETAEHAPQASGTLREFLRLAPRNVAAPEVRRLLASEP